MSDTSSDTLFDQLGGEAAVNAAVDIFYRKVLSRLSYQPLLRQR